MLEHFDESLADNFAFSFRVGDSFQLGKEQFGSIFVLKFNMKMFSENFLDNVGFAGAKKPVICFT